MPHFQTWQTAPWRDPTGGNKNFQHQLWLDQLWVPGFWPKKHPISIWNIYEIYIYMKYIYIWNIWYDINDGYTERILSQLSYFHLSSAQCDHCITSRAVRKLLGSESLIQLRFEGSDTPCYSVAVKGGFLFPHLPCDVRICDHFIRVLFNFISHWSTSERLRYHLVI